jgi:hypothetical protein
MDLFLGLIFGSIGTVYAIYGKRSHDPTYLIVGFLLILYPYLFSNVVLILIIGAVLAAIPIARRKGYF